MISIVIPCHPPYFQYLDRLFVNINTQTLLPLDVILVCSQCTQEKASFLYKQLELVKRGYELSIISSEDVCFASENRNKGVVLAKGDYIMFLDADDIYHKQKIEITSKMIEICNPNIIMHHFYNTTVNLNETITNIIYDRLDEFIKQNYFPRNRENEITSEYTGFSLLRDIHYGSTVVKKSIFDTVKYENKMKLGEDGLFVRDVLEKHGEVYLLDCSLMVYNRRDTKISIVIPCYPPHFKFIERIIENINSQTFVPKEVIFVLSECCKENNKEVYPLIFSKINNNYDISIISSTQKCSAGENRNKGASVAKGEYIMFLDADDLYHNKKIEISAGIIEKFNPTLLIHSFHREKNVNVFKEITDVRVDKWDEYLLKTYFPRDREREIIMMDTTIYTGFDITHGVVLVKREVFEQVKYNNYMRYGEDGLFVRDVLEKFGNIYITNCKLMIYNPMLS